MSVRVVSRLSNRPEAVSLEFSRGRRRDFGRWDGGVAEPCLTRSE